MLGCRSWRLAVNLTQTFRYQFGMKSQSKISLSSPCLLQINLSVRRGSLELWTFLVMPFPASLQLLNLSLPHKYLMWNFGLQQHLIQPHPGNSMRQGMHHCHNYVPELLMIKCKRHYPIISFLSCQGKTPC